MLVQYGSEATVITCYVLPICVQGEYEESFSIDALFTAVLMDRHETIIDLELPVSVTPPIRWLPSQEDLLL